jgi:hypothetical protein
VSRSDQPTERNVTTPNSESGWAARRNSSSAAPPATRPASRVPTRTSAARASRPPLRAIHSHSIGATDVPVQAYVASRRAGSGFHEDPTTVLRSRWRISRPQMSQYQAS